MSKDVQTITDLLLRAGSKRFLDLPSAPDLGFAEPIHYPFLAIVGQKQMKLALMLAVINPNLGGVLLIGPRGTAKTTAIRGLTQLLPDVERSRCLYGCLPEDILTGGIDAVCPDCAKRFGENERLTYSDHVHIVELPLNSRLDDVIGGLDEKSGAHLRMRIRRGILSRADQNILYADEVNLLPDDVVNAMLDAASQGTYSIQRGIQVATYRSRFTLFGSMNPEEGSLRPQMMDRFGLRVIVTGLADPEDRLEAYRRSIAYRSNPLTFQQQYEEFSMQIREELQNARKRLEEISLPKRTLQAGLELVQQLGIHSLRAELTLFEAARAYALIDGRKRVRIDDLKLIAPMALRMRRSAYIQNFLHDQTAEEKEILDQLEALPE